MYFVGLRRLQQKKFTCHYCPQSPSFKIYPNHKNKISLQVKAGTTSAVSGGY